MLPPVSSRISAGTPSGPAVAVVTGVVIAVVMSSMGSAVWAKAGDADKAATATDSNRTCFFKANPLISSANRTLGGNPGRAGVNDTKYWPPRAASPALGATRADHTQVPTRHLASAEAKGNFPHFNQVLEG